MKQSKNFIYQQNLLLTNKLQFESEMDMKRIYAIRQIIVSFVALVFLIWAFFQNELWAKIIIIPFLICSFAILMENIFLILNKMKVSNLFKYIFRISFFVYVFGFLSYMVYYSIANKSYPILIVVVVFLVFAIYFFKKAFFIKK